MRPWSFVVIALLSLVALSSCGGLPGFASGAGTAAPNQITYDGAIAVSIKKGQTFPGTTMGYQGRSPDGRALVTIDGQAAPKSTADSVSFVGAPISGALLRLSTRVGTFDDNAVNLIGTIHLEVNNPAPQIGTVVGDPITAFGIPVHYTVNRGTSIPGSTVQFVGKGDQGAQFINVEGYPYRQQLDSVVWNGHLRDKVGLKLDLRLINYSEDSATLVGTAQVRFER